MSTTTITEPATTTTTRIWPTAIAFGAVAAAATTALAGIADASGVSLDVEGEAIPLVAFTQMTFLFSVLGLLIAVGLRRWTNDARRVWIRTTVVLTGLSFVPDLLADAGTPTKLTLMATHVLAASIVIPAVASRLPRR